MRYVAFTQGGDSHTALTNKIIATPGWRRVFSSFDLTVLVHRTTLVHPLSDSQGIVLGRVFEGSVEAATIDLSNGLGDLADKYWGNFVAFVRDEAHGRVTALRDPGGCVQCFHASIGDTFVFFSHLCDFETLSPAPLRLDWRQVESVIARGVLPTSNTPVAGVKQLLPGECLIHSRRYVSKRLYWDPLEVAEQKPLTNELAARHSLRTSVQTSVHAWAAAHPKVAVLLSGGLDSAIVLGCLRDAPQLRQAIAINYYSAGADSDEREYANLAAAESGVPLVEEQRDPRTSWEPLLYLRKTATPYAAIGALQTRDHLAALASQTGIDAQLSGTGGDVLFYRHAAFLATADYVRTRPLGRELLQHVFSAAYLDRNSIWGVLAQTAYYGWGRARFPLRPTRPFVRPLLGPAAIAALRRTDCDESIHPLFEASRGHSPGKLYQASCILYALCSPENPIDDFDPTPEIAPLLSTPVLNACLRIPLYRLMYAGRDRALARDAFADRLPSAIAQRQSKGGLEEHARDSLLRNLSIARELLLDDLVKSNLLDRSKITDMLEGRPSEIQGRIAEIYEYINVGAWLMSWCRPSARSSELRPDGDKERPSENVG